MYIWYKPLEKTKNNMKVIKQNANRYIKYKCWKYLNNPKKDLNGETEDQKAAGTNWQN